MLTKDPVQSSQVSRTFIRHGGQFFDQIHARQPSIVNCWVSRHSCQMVEMEGKALSELLRPQFGESLTSILGWFSLENVYEEAHRTAPFLCQLLGQVGRVGVYVQDTNSSDMDIDSDSDTEFNTSTSGETPRRKKDLVSWSAGILTSGCGPSQSVASSRLRE